MPSQPALEGAATAAETGQGRFQVAIDVAGQTIIGDEPVEAGGLGTGPTPFQLLASALAACTTMTLSLYARQKAWPVTHISTTAGHSREPGQTQADLFTRRISLEGDLTEEQRARLLEIANRCPVHRTLTAGARVQTSLGTGPAPCEPAAAHAEQMQTLI